MLKVLMITDGYLPGFRSGGPVRSLAALVEQLGDDIDFRIITAGNEMGESLHYDNVALDTWTQVGKASVWYTQDRRLMPWFWRRRLSEVSVDIVYLNSVFSPVSVLFLLWRKLRILEANTVLLAPRGEFSLGALQQSAVKKRMFLMVARLLGLWDDISFHASAPQEREDIVRTLGANIDCLVAPNLVTESGVLRTRGAKKPGEASFAWLSRISPKKNLTGAICLLSRASGRCSLTAYGPMEDLQHWRESIEATKLLPASAHFSYGGELPHEAVAEVLASHQFLLFPTLGENFGHVIAEALNQGLPVLVSDQTPWRDLETAGVGWDIPLDQVGKWTEVIERCIQMDDEEYKAISVRCRGYVDIWMKAHGGKQANLEMFSRIIRGVI